MCVDEAQVIGNPLDEPIKRNVDRAADTPRLDVLNLRDAFIANPDLEASPRNAKFRGTDPRRGLPVEPELDLALDHGKPLGSHLLASARSLGGPANDG